MARKPKKSDEERDEAATPLTRVGEKPRFVRCSLTGPDGKTRPGWELWIGDHCFGRSDRKELLIRSLERQQQPPQSFHWREVHRQRFTKDQRDQEEESDEEPEDELEDDTTD